MKPKLGVFGLFGRGRMSKAEKRHIEIIMKLSELKDALTGIDAKLTEASGEITGLIQELRDALGDADIPGDAETILKEIDAKAKALADIVA